MEAWVWTKLQAGQLANLDQHHDDQGPLPPADPRKPEDWQDGRRRLSVLFLETILLEEPCRSATHRHGVRIWRAWFDQEIALDNTELKCPLWLDHSRFDKAVLLAEARARTISFRGSRFAAALDLERTELRQMLVLIDGAEFQKINLRGAKVGGDVDLRGAKVEGILDLEMMEIGRGLVMRDGAEFQEIKLRGASVGYIDMSGTKVKGALDLQRVKIGGGLTMRDGAEFQKIDLVGAKVGGDVDMAGAKVKGTLDLHKADIGQSLTMNNGAEFQEIHLRDVKVGSQLSLTSAKVKGALYFERAKIGQNLFMRDSAEFQEIDMRDIEVTGHLDLSDAKVNGSLAGQTARFNGGAVFKRCEMGGAVEFVGAVFGVGVFLGGAKIGWLDLCGARIRGELSLTPPMPSWTQRGGVKPRISLRSASCEAVRDGGEAAAWPDETELEGFTYNRFGGLGTDPETDPARRGAKWFINWLAKDRPFTPQPYHQCASVLREMGRPEMANDVLYAGRERERAEALRRGDNPRWSGLTLLKWLIGYGYGDRLLWRPLSWAALFVAIGVCVTYADASAFPGNSFWWRTFFSLDMLLSIVELSREHTLVQAGLDGLAYGWFVVQRLLGWVLALFLIAGLTGLTK